MMGVFAGEKGKRKVQKIFENPGDTISPFKREVGPQSLASVGNVLGAEGGSKFRMVHKVAYTQRRNIQA